MNTSTEETNFIKLTTLTIVKALNEKTTFTEVKKPNEVFTGQSRVLNVQSGVIMIQISV